MRRLLLVFAALALMLTAVIVHAGSASASPTWVQGNAAETGSGNTLAAAFQQPVSAGDTVIVFAVWNNAAAVAVSDSAGDAFKAATSRESWGSRGGSSAQVFYAAAAQSGTLQVSAQWSNEVGQFGQLFVQEYSNVSGTVDGAVVNNAFAKKGNGAGMTTPSLSVPGNDLLFAGGASSGTITAAATGWSTRSTAFGDRVADRNVSPGSFAAGMTQSGTAWVMQMVAFRAAPTPTTTVPTTTAPTTTAPTTTAPTTTAPTTTAPTTTAPSTTMSGAQDQCAFTTFCDNFAVANPGGRGGDLDESKWSLSRLSQETNASQGTVNKFVPVNAEFCMTHQVRLADNDSFVCGQQFGESNHWMEGIFDNGSYVMDSNRTTQPFDFANRTGTLDFSVDAKSTGGHGSWIEVWLTQDPMQSPHTDKPGTHLFPRNGIGFTFDDPENCGPSSGYTTQTFNSLRVVDEFANYVDNQHVVNSPCFATKDDSANHFQIKVATGHVEVWASDNGGSNFRQIANVTTNLDFTRGYWNLQHAQYNASKCDAAQDCQNSFTYHWHAVSFDGPVVPVDRDYQIPDSLVTQCGGNNNLCGVNLGWNTGGYPPGTTPSWTVPNVDLTGASQAFISYNAWYTCCNQKVLDVTVNGHVHQVPDPNPDAATTSGDVWRYSVLSVPLSDLVQGTNAISVSIVPGSGCSGSCPSVANVDLEVIHS
jgi:hypothetical protein